MRRMTMCLVAALGLVAGCGSGGASPLEVVTAAAAETTKANTAKVSERIEIAPPASASTREPVVVTGDGEIDFAARKANLAITAAGVTVPVVVDGATIYEHVPQLAEAAGGKEWFKLDFDTIGEVAGIENLGTLAQSQNTDPSTFLQYLRGASGEVNEIGKERVGGADTTWYSLSVDVEKAAADAPAEQRATVRQIVESFGIRTIPTEVWIDREGRARRVKQVFDYTKAAGNAEIPASALPKSVTMTLEFSDFGTPVTVSVPPASEVADLFEVLGRLRD